MKYLKSITSLVLIAFLFAGCKDDGADFTLSYDGANNTAPELPASTYESGAMFPTSFAGNDAGNELYAVELYIEEIPNTAELRVYLNGRTDDELVYSKSILREIGSRDWITHTLDAPVTLDGSDLWVTLRYDQQGNVRVLGCDSGPEESLNSNWHYDAADNEWVPFNDRVNADINWNIRALVRVPEE